MDIWSRADDRSLINLVPEAVAQSLVESTQAEPELFHMDERTLLLALRQKDIPPTPTDNRLRLSFWNEYERAQANQEKMNITTVFAGICTRAYFYGRYLKRPEKAAWLVCPPASYEVVAKEALTFGLEQLREILSLPIKDAQGRVNVKLGELQAKIVAMLDQRLKGGITQTIKSMNLNVSTTDSQVAKAAMQGSMEDIESRIRELESRERRALHLTEEKKNDGTDAIEVESTPVS
jgi:hypothetical protein